ncbi:MAG: TolB family protein [Planctomycetota bacterium]
MPAARLGVLLCSCFLVSFLLKALHAQQADAGAGADVEVEVDEQILARTKAGFALVDARSGHSRQLRQPKGSVSRAVHLSQTGDIAYARFHAGRREVVVHDKRGQPFALGPNHGHDHIWEMGWSHNGNWLAYRIDGHALGKGSVHLLSRDGATARSLTPAGQHDGTFDWAPDGLHLAVAATTSSEIKRYASGIWVERTSAIDVLDAATGTRQRLAAFAFEIDEMAWSPDGIEIAVLDGGGRLYRISRTAPPRAREGPVDRDRALAKGFAHGHKPRWSRNGNETLMLRHRKTGGSQLVVVDRDGQSAWSHDAAAEAKGKVTAYDWSADSQRIVFATSSGELYILERQTHAVRNLGSIDSPTSLAMTGSTRR